VSAWLAVLAEAGEALDAPHSSVDRWTRMVNAVGDAHDAAVRQRLELLYLFAYRCRVPPRARGLHAPTLQDDPAAESRVSDQGKDLTALLSTPAAEVIRADGAAQFLRAAIVPSLLEALEFAMRAPELKPHP